MNPPSMTRWIIIAAVLAALAGAAGGFLLARQFPASSSSQVLDHGRPSDEQVTTVTLEDRDISSLVTLDAIVVESGAGYQLQGTITSETISYQLAVGEPYQVRALINGRAGGFECEWNGVISGDIPVSSGQQGERLTGSVGVTIGCDIPTDIVVAPGLTGVMAIAVEQPRKVPTLPRTAVFGSQQSGVVIVVTDDGERQRREVTLGEADTQFVEVVEGLAPGEKVLAVPLETDLLSAP